ncbi:MAG: 5-formyltetrahydrofolate cyclo-ligase [Sphingomonas sp.]|jgi:5-formyltetrahydrofolate cyclo-ligase
MTPADAKHRLRAEMRRVRARFAAQRAAIPVPEALLERVGAGQIVASYLPLGSEADPALLAQAALGLGALLALPHVTGTADAMRFLRWSPGDALETGVFGLRQPQAEAQAVHPDIVLTPLVAFNLAGQRLGQGAGHYDRVFAALPHALRIGVAWSIQQNDQLVAQPWDVPLHAIITEQGWQTITPRG